MREIKFRLYSKKDNSLSEIDLVLTRSGDFAEIDWLGGTFDYLGDDYVIQQYTGLKDKNGKEIYEGDIVRSGFSTAVVKWDDDIDQDFYWGNACGFVFNFDPETMNPNGDYELIGNIFEGVDK